MKDIKRDSLKIDDEELEKIVGGVNYGIGQLIICPRCCGRGTKLDGTPCTFCSGAGQIQR